MNVSNGAESQCAPFVKSALKLAFDNLSGLFSSDYQLFGSSLESAGLTYNPKQLTLKDCAGSKLSIFTIGRPNKAFYLTLTSSSYVIFSNFSVSCYGSPSQYIKMKTPTSEQSKWNKSYSTIKVNSIDKSANNLEYVFDEIFPGVTTYILNLNQDLGGSHFSLFRSNVFSFFYNITIRGNANLTSSAYGALLLYEDVSHKIVFTDILFEVSEF